MHCFILNYGINIVKYLSDWGKNCIFVTENEYICNQKLFSKLPK